MIRTARLRLRAATEADVPRVAEALNDWAVAQWLNRPPFPYAQADARAFLLAPAQPGFRERWVVADGGDRLLGMVTLEPGGGRHEAGYWLHPDAQGRGFMAEALAGVLAAAERHEPGIAVFAVIDSENRASRAVLLRCGFKAVAERRLERPRRRGTSATTVFEWSAGSG